MSEPGDPLRRRRRGQPRGIATTSAADAIASVIAIHRLSVGMRAQRLTTEWTELVGERIASRTRPVGVTDRALVIEVASSAWLHELSLLRLQLLASLTGRLGEPRLFDDLKFRLAGRDKPAPLEPPRARPRAAARPRAVPATGLARERILDESSSVDDVELRELIARVRITHDR